MVPLNPSKLAEEWKSDFSSVLLHQFFNKTSRTQLQRLTLCPQVPKCTRCYKWKQCVNNTILPTTASSTELGQKHTPLVGWPGHNATCRKSQKQETTSQVTHVQPQGPTGHVTDNGATLNNEENSCALECQGKVSAEWDDMQVLLFTMSGKSDRAWYSSNVIKTEGLSHLLTSGQHSSKLTWARPSRL